MRTLTLAITASAASALLVGCGAATPRTEPHADAPHRAAPLALSQHRPTHVTCSDLRPSPERAYAAVVLGPTTTRGSTRLLPRDANGYRTVLGVLDARVGPRCRPLLLHVQLPGPPNGRAGWIEPAAVRVYPVADRIVVDLSSRTLVAYHGRRPRLRARVAVGTPQTPTPVGSYIVATEPQPAALAAALLPNRRMAFDSKNFLFYFRVTDDHRVIFGGRAEFTQPSEGTIRRAAAILRGGMTRVFPQLESAAVEYAWGGNVAFTRDQLPHAGRLEGKYVAAGYCGHGIAMATWLGDAAGRLASGERVTHPLVTLTKDPFPSIPFYTGTPWFLPLVGAYYKVKDWIQ